MLRRAVAGLYRLLFHFPPEEQSGPVPPFSWLDRPTGIRLLSEGRARYRQRPLGQWTTPSDSGEWSFIIYALVFREDGTGSYVFWNIDNQGTFSGTFEFEPHADFEVRVKLLGREGGPAPEILIRYRFAVRTDQYGTNILCARFTPQTHTRRTSGSSRTKSG